MDKLDVPQVLVVEDDPDICENLQQILELDGYSVDTAGSIAEARQNGSWARYFAVILDRQLPDGTSDELMREIRANNADTAIIVITGLADVDSTVNALRHRVGDFFLKPFNPDILRSSLAQLLRAKRAEKRASEAERLAIIGQMIAGIAHESRNAIQRIQSGIDLLKLDVHDQNLVSQIDKIEEANISLKSMLDEIRDYAAPINLEHREVDLSSVWRHAWANVNCNGNNGKAKLQESTNNCNLQCSVDDFRLEQVFRNIFENSLAACENAPVIQIECADSGQSCNGSSSEAVKIAIRDNGPGFAIDHRQKVFEPFFTTRQRGTGLGMSIVKRTIEAHGGSVAIGNGDSPGAEVIITMPRRASQVQ